MNIGIEKKWIYLIALSLIWGSSFILIKKSLLGLSPLQVGSLRIVFSSIIIFLIAFNRISSIPKKKWRWISLSAIVGTFFPAFLFELAQGKTIEVNSNLFYILLYIAIFPSIGSYYCWAGAVSIIGANRAGIFLSLIPLFSTIFAMIFFNEKFLFFHFIGSVLIILGLFLSNKKVTNA